MVNVSRKIIVFYDQSCSSCVKDQVTFERLAGKRAKLFEWFDITGQDDVLHELGIKPLDALKELHVQDADGKIYSEIEAYSLIMKKIPILMPLGIFISLPIIKPILGYFYRKSVHKRLSCEGRL